VSPSAVDDDDVSESRVCDQFRAAPAHVAGYVDRTTLAVTSVTHRESVGLGVKSGAVGVVGTKNIGSEVQNLLTLDTKDTVSRRCLSTCAPPIARQVTVWEALWRTVVSLRDDPLCGVDDNRAYLVADAQRPLPDQACLADTDLSPRKA
jgi:hypothetical protein